MMAKSILRFEKLLNARYKAMAKERDRLRKLEDEIAQERERYEMVLHSLADAIEALSEVV